VRRTLSTTGHLAVACLLLCSAAAHAAAGAGERLAALFEAEWERTLRQQPMLASRLGDRRYDDRWPDLSIDALEGAYTADLRDLEALRAIPFDGLTVQEQLDYRLFERRLEDRIEAFGHRAWLMPVSHRGGVQTRDQLGNRIRMVTVADYENWLTRLETLPDHLAQTRALMEQGLREGRVWPAVIMARVPRQLRSQIVEDPAESLFFARFADLPDAIAPEDAERLRARARAAIEDRIVPAYEAFLEFFETRYLSAAPDSVATGDRPDGEAHYAYLARRFTTTAMTPDQLHALGLAEVARIRGDMQVVIDAVGFEGSFEDFLTFLRTDPQFYYESAEELLEAYRAVSKRIDPELVHLFGRLPRTPYGVIPIPDAIAPDTTTAYYTRPAADGSRAGFYYVNLYRPEVRPKYEIEVLSVHEAVPGHHLQIALAMEMDELPNFRRYGGFTAFIEGWGLYSERLGYEIGLYEDPYSHFGALTYDMWRAVRLVVDTGMHVKGWSRERAIAYFLANAAKTEADVVNEIDRYIGNPGQALAYKAGQLKLLELRGRAEAALGDAFDVRAFHDEVLSRGALPLDLLEEYFDRWLAGQTAGG
jgi:uncharacterized protein (DUF885 family)